MYIKFLLYKKNKVRLFCSCFVVVLLLFCCCFVVVLLLFCYCFFALFTPYLKHYCSLSMPSSRLFGLMEREHSTFK